MKKAIKLLIVLLIAFSLISCEFTNNKINEDVKIYERQENKIYFGKYPQTLVTDNSLIEELNTKAGTLPTTANIYNWTNYNYYIEGSITSYMYYQDIDLDNNGTFDYRSVYFTQYRPFWTDDLSSSAANSYQDDNNYLTNTVYWFSYDPIEWDILKEENGKALIIANLILDSQDYCLHSFNQFNHNGGYGYANNYELSNIRKFLNEDFYSVAFNSLQKELIEITEVDNSLSSTGDTSNPYICNNTNDKIFLLSRQEALNYYTSESERVAKGTDYAKSQGLWVRNWGDEYDGYSDWWLRSPDYSISNRARRVSYDGYIYFKYVYHTLCGVRPVCTLNLQ